MSHHGVAQPPPLPVGPEAAAERGRRIADIAAAIAAGTYRVPAELVAAAVAREAGFRCHLPPNRPAR